VRGPRRGAPLCDARAAAPPGALGLLAGGTLTPGRARAAHEQNAGPIGEILDYFEFVTPGAHCAGRRRRAGVHLAAASKE